MAVKPLIADLAIGNDITDCRVLASHPDERRTPDGKKPSLTRPTIVLRFDGRQFRAETSLPVPLYRGWSSVNGTSYCTPIRGRHAYVHCQGEWNREEFSANDEDILRVGGLAGADSSQDMVFVSTNGALFVRAQGGWTRHVPPEPGRRVFSVGALSAAEIYVCSDIGMLLWRPAGFQQLADRPRPIMKEIVVVEEEIFAGNDRLFHFAKGAGWKRWEPTLADVTALIEVDGAIVAGTFEKGVFERRDGAFVAVTRPFMCLDVQRVGDGAFAVGDGAAFARVAGTWREQVLPSCAPGMLP